jgi:hypothetical protein
VSTADRLPDAATASTAPEYSERLWPGPWFWVIALTSVAALAVAYTSAFGPAVGAGVALAGVLAVGVGAARMAARIEVTPEGLRAGRALLPWHHAGRALPLDAAGARIARGPRGDPNAYILLRPGVGPGAVVVEVTDPEDPHRTWLLATRHPTVLARAIDQARGTLAP